ncbi:hypothetical protein [Mesorhizobium sp.]|uniref:hypothetical protein n=1 Tax=Mesorhizobium sp. TaxID=1871066 RepID=UPI0025C34A40|nr:hypothetical protein [Mesorhizobium sp.]
MKTRILDEAALRAISPAGLRAYAQAEGWNPSGPFGKHSHIYVSSKNGEELIIPATSSLGDYANVVSEILALLAKNESRDELQVYRDLVSSDKDVIRVRSPDAEDDGSVRVEVGVELVVNSRELVLSAACSAWSPRPTYRAGRIKQAEDYMSRVRLGQTERGSFVVTLLAPVPPSIGQTNLWPVEEEEPFERLVTRRLAGGLDAAAEAIEKVNLGGSMDAFESAVSRGLSANLCEAAASLSDRGDGVEVSVTWARTRRAPQTRWARLFTRPEGEMLREAARRFEAKQSRPDEQVEGIITKLAREDSQIDGWVSMKAVIDGQLKSVRMLLQPGEYKVAIDAHKTNQAIQAVGTLERIGSRWHLIRPKEISLIEDRDDDLDALPLSPLDEDLPPTPVLE